MTDTAKDPTRGDDYNPRELDDLLIVLTGKVHPGIPNLPLSAHGAATGGVPILWLVN
jgi:hypothetical protein